MRECGGAFTLDKEAGGNASIRVDDKWVVEVRRDSKIVVARGEGPASAVEAMRDALRAAQRGLDLLSIRGLGDLLIQRAEDENLVWWSADGEGILRACSVATLRIDVPPVTAVVTDAEGKVRPSPPEPQPRWHPSFRYFRLAQVSEEVFDAYRNLFLALESILSTATPLRSGERETDWIPRALRDAEAKGLSLASFAQKGTSDPVDAIFRDLYSTTRTSTFHAKTSRPALLPLDGVDRRDVLESLSRLAALYLALVHQTLGVRRPGGAMFNAGFDLLIGNSVDSLQIYVTDGPIRMSETQTVLNPGGGLIRRLPTTPAPELDEPFLRTILGEASAAELGDLTHISRLATTTEDGTLMTGGQLEGHLTLGGLDRFQAVMGIRGLNVRTPRSFYST